MTDNHPECGPYEVFITNADNETWMRINWKTKRKGKVAYTMSGEEIGSKWRGCFPVFVTKAEIFEKDPKLLESIMARN